MSKKEIAEILKDPIEYANNLEISKLVKLLQKLSDAYYADIEIVDDSIYDKLESVLKERDPKNKFLFQTGIKNKDKNDVELPYTMPSLNKIKPKEKELKKWFKKYNEGSYIIMDKLDGISVQLHKDNKGNINLYTKKQTNMGTSKQYLIEHLINKKTLENIPNNTSIRGEVVISKNDFEQFKDEFKNPRSVAAGLMNTDKIDNRILKVAKYITYDILSQKEKIKKKLKQLSNWGFDTVWNYEIKMNQESDESDDESEEESEEINEETNEEEEEEEKESSEDMEKKLIKILLQRKIKSEYLIDGLVVFDNSTSYNNSLDNPKHAMAFKMNHEADMKDVEVEEVIWQPTKYYYLQPIVRIKPTQLSGNTTVTYLTGHNAKYIYNNNIGKGSIIKIVRSNEVIPFIVDVVKPSKKPSMPNMKYHWNATEVKIIVDEPSKEILEQIEIKIILHFFRKLKVKYLSEGIITKLYENNFDSIKKILNACSTRNETLFTIKGLGAKIINKIYDEIEKALNKIKLHELMHASTKFGETLGSKKLKKIVDEYPDILEWSKEIKKDIEYINEKILKIKGFSDKSSMMFSKNFKSFCDFIKDINYKIESKKKKSSKKLLLKDEKIVMTGFRSDEISEFIENNGGTISSSVSKNTTLVIYIENEKTQSKLIKAKELNIKTITRNNFEKKYMS